MHTKITFEEESDMSVQEYPSNTYIEIEKNTADMTLPDVIELLIIPMLKAVGYADETIEKHLGEY